jgi:hypothetical protein
MQNLQGFGFAGIGESFRFTWLFLGYKILFSK